MMQRLITVESNLKSLQTQRTAVERALAEIRQRNNDLLDDSVAYEQLAGAKDLQTRSRLREEIRRKVGSIQFDFASARFPAPIGLVNYSCRVMFVNGASRYLFFAKNGVYVFEKPAEFSEGWSPEFKKI